jgi:glycosyltransferase involved in cell wall biosynthesis
MTEQLVLTFVYHFPPENAIGGAQPFRFSKYISRLGYTCCDFSAADQTGRDDSNTDYVPDLFVTRPWHSISRQLERAVRKVFLPGELGTQWFYRASRAARAYIRAHPGVRVTIFSSFPPLGPHLTGWQLAQSDGLPWIANCRDPLVDEFTAEYRTPFQKQLYRWLERVIARTADVVIANTDAAMFRWREKFPSLNGKVQLIWNGFDPEDRIQLLPVLSRDCKILSYVGEVYHGRDLTMILKSVERLIAAGRFAAGSMHARLVGPVQTGSLASPEFIHRAQAEGWLDLVTEQIPRREARQIAQTSNGLLLLRPQSAVQVPGKLFEYLQIGRPILAVIQPDSPSERLLERSDALYFCLYPGSSPEAIDNAVAGFFDLSSTAVAASPWFEEQFNTEHQKQTLDPIIRSLLSVPARGTNPWPPCNWRQTYCG